VESKNIRSDVRVELHLDLMIQSIFTQDDLLVTLDEPFIIHIKDLSVGGLFILCEKDIPHQHKLILELPIYNTILFCTAQIMRKIPCENGFSYACNLLDLDESHRILIRKFIFEEQVTRKRRGF
jgi:hypothetical protein